MKTSTADDNELGISELAKRCGVVKSTVHRLAGTLLEEGLVRQNPENGRYSLGIGLFSLGSLVRSRLDMTSESKHLLKELREQTQENVRLAVLERQSVAFLHDFESFNGRFREACLNASWVLSMADAGARINDCQRLEGRLQRKPAAFTPRKLDAERFCAPTIPERSHSARTKTG